MPPPKASFRPPKLDAKTLKLRWPPRNHTQANPKVLRAQRGGLGGGLVLKPWPSCINLDGFVRSFSMENIPFGTTLESFYDLISYFGLYSFFLNLKSWGKTPQNQRMAWSLQSLHLLSRQCHHCTGLTSICFLQQWPHLFHEYVLLLGLHAILCTQDLPKSFGNRMSRPAASFPTMQCHGVPPWFLKIGTRWSVPGLFWGGYSLG